MTFAIAALNWALMEWWASASVTGPVNGTYSFASPAFIYDAVLVFSLPVVLSILTTTYLPEKVIVAPTDINAITFGIAAIYLLLATQYYAPVYFLQTLFVVMYLLLATILQNGLVTRIVGIRGSTEALSVRQYSTQIGPENLCSILRSELLWKACGFQHEWNSDETVDFWASDGNFRFHVGVSPFPKASSNERQDGHGLISILGYERGGLEIRKSDASKAWFRGKCSAFVATVSGTRIPITNEELSLEPIQSADDEEAVRAVPKPIVDYVLRPTRNLASQLSTQGEGVLPSVAILFIMSIATLGLLVTNVLTLDYAFGILVAILVTQIGQIAWARGRRSPG